ncbi:hypothetical protein [Nevskia sp.]|uniref:hypothetical protein n=1 Tax=Nevskia sp. TaxID=1929292 RepID=UPI003F7218E2
MSLQAALAVLVATMQLVAEIIKIVSSTSKARRPMPASDSRMASVPSDQYTQARGWRFWVGGLVGTVSFGNIGWVMFGPLRDAPLTGSTAALLVLAVISLFSVLR